MKNTINDYQDAISLFIESCEKYAFYADKGDNKLVNKNYGLIKKTVDYLRENNYEYKLKPFLESDDYWIKLWASTFLLKHYEQESILVLEEIASKSIPRISFDAKMVLQEWRKGNLNI